MAPPATTAPRRVVVDVGGTNTRVALFDPARDRPYALGLYINREHSSVEEIITLWLGILKEDAPEICCIAAAAPPSGDWVQMINIDWAFSCAELARHCGFEQVAWLNDFHANAYSLPHLKPGEQVLLRSGEPREGSALAVVGPGTGFGGATLEWINGQALARGCEPGHMGLSPTTEEELEVFRLLLLRYDEIDIERLVSGSGLLLLYQSLAKIRALKPEIQSPAGVSAAAMRGEDELSVSALATFCGLLGSACGDFALANGAYGGLYLTGGIIPHIQDFLQSSRFLARFSQKGDLSAILQAVPVYVITAAQPGLIGAAHAPIQS